MVSLAALPGRQAGDVLFLTQMQGAALAQLSDASRYGEVLFPRNAGYYDDAQTTATFAAVPPRCFDGIRNGDETDLDCGGACAPCEDARSCLASGTARAPSASTESAPRARSARS